MVGARRARLKRQDLKKEYRLKSQAASASFFKNTRKPRRGQAEKEDLWGGGGGFRGKKGPGDSEASAHKV